ncbi:MAG: bifunctional folylpolyglutamate synthase/dihydrofolate synthase [Patescibacteria group bacterium]|nr:bifunctional folylpolyglutamate synthase/dihydrofolate synthase [Patescibacteria group bacterium]
MTVKTYDQAIEYLETFIKPVVFAPLRPPSLKKGYEGREKISQKQARMWDPLDRMRKLLKLLDNPQEKFKSVLIGGTSGKGSTAYFVSHILKTAGYKTGLTISPHLQKINERIQINDTQISDEDFIFLLNKVVPAIEKMQKINNEPSYFEILVAMAFLYFEQKNVDIVVAEVGMGGIYDATNTLNPLIAVITNVSLDHTDILGKTVEKIAKEKTGIIKRSVGDSNLLAVITGVKQKSVINIIEQKCRETSSELYRWGKDFNYGILEENISGSNFNFKNQENLKNIHLSAIGEYQIENASLAIKTVLKLQKFGFKISEQNIKEALSTSFFPGRFEVLKLNSSVGDSNLLAGELIPRQARDSNMHLSRKFKSPPSQNNFALVLDGAHNLAKMKAFISSLKKIYPYQKKIFIVAFKDDKDAKGMLKEIMKIADSVIITEFHRKIDIKGYGTMGISKIKDLSQRLIGLWPKISRNTRIYSTENSEKALKKAFEILRCAQNDNASSSVIVVTGSLYLVGEVKDLLSLEK